MNTILMAMTIVAVICALGLHSVTQTCVAWLLGDPTSVREKRLSFNPRRYLSPIGLCAAVISAFPILPSVIPAGLGWGKPVRATAQNFRTGPSAGLILIALSGIAIHFLVGIVIAKGLSFVPATMADIQQQNVCTSILVDARGGLLQTCLQSWQPGWILRLEQFAYVFAAVNITLGFLNLIPLNPLDGYTVLFALLPASAAIAYRNSSSWHEIILLAAFLFLPLLLSFSGAPSPFQFLQALGFSIVSSLTGNLFDFVRLL